MSSLNGYEVLETLHESPRTLVYRAIRQEDRRSVILKEVAARLPPRSELARYRREYEILRSLRHPAVIRAHALCRHENTLVLVLEDFGGESLRAHLGRRRFTTSEVLHIARNAAIALVAIHEAGISHRDINPSNLVYNEITRTVKMIDFGCATEAKVSISAFGPPNAMEGTLAYMSPEQTGRINRSVDHRTDFYSLGMTMYEMLVGRRAFETTDLLELVHAQIARTPMAPKDVDHAIPGVLSDIVLKLLSKNPDDRYETASGLAHDLGLCEAALERGATIEPFTLGEHDVSGVFRIPEKLYGRADEIARLTDWFVQGMEDEPSRRALGATRRASSVLVTGPAGVGKSILIRELGRVITLRNGQFASGKFDQLKRNVPYGGLGVAIAEITQGILLGTNDDVRTWGHRLEQALGENAALLGEIAPAILNIVKTPHEILALGPADAQNRLERAVNVFLGLVCEHAPLVLFLDDLQWADDATLRLLESLLNNDELRQLHLIGSYRDNEVDATHPLTLTLERMKAQGLEPHRLMLRSLDVQHVVELCCDLLHRKAEDVVPLARVLLEKTDGNPFFLAELLHTLHRDRAIQFDSKTRSFYWTMDRVQSFAMTKNVVDLLLASMHRLSPETQRVLHMGACFGESFTIDALAQCYGKTIRETTEDLAPALDLTLVRAASVATLGVGNAEDAELFVPRYRFPHDRVQQAAYALGDAQDTQRIHLHLGRTLLSGKDVNSLDEQIFDIADHLNRARELMTDAAELQTLAEIDLQAGRRAKRAAADSAAKNYLRHARDIVDALRLPAQTPLSVAIDRELAEVEYLLGELEAAESLVERVLAHASTDVAKAEVYNLLLVVHTMQGRYDRGVGAAHQGLALLGMTLPQENKRQAFEEELAAVETLLAGRELMALVAAPEADDPKTRMLIELMANVCPPYYAFDLETFNILAARIVRISLEKGMSPCSAYGFVALGIPMVQFYHRHAHAHQLAKLALVLAERFGNRSQWCRASLIFGSSINHFAQPLVEANDIFRDALAVGVAGGEIQFAGYCLAHAAPILFHQGMNLDDVESRVNEHIHFGLKTKNFWAIDTMRGITLVTKRLSGKTAYDAAEEDAFRNDARLHQNFQALAMYEVARAYEHFIFGRFDEAFAAVQAADALAFCIHPLGLISAVAHEVIGALVSAARYEHADTDEQKRMLERIDRSIQNLKRWAEGCPQNFVHHVHLLEAERARIGGQTGRLVDAYASAVATAEASGNSLDTAVAHEVVSRYWEQRNMPRYAKTHLADAFYHYHIWGAMHKVAQLGAAHPELVEGRTRRADPTSTMTTSISTTTGRHEALDNVALLRATQAISERIHLHGVLETLMRIVLEVSGARRGIVALLHDDALRVEAEGEIDPLRVSCLASIPLETRADLPLQILGYVARTRERVVLSNAFQDKTFGGDGYFAKMQVRSVLCAPIMHVGKFLGVLYLEHASLPDVFTPARTQVLEVLSGQTAISIENARMYADLEKLVEVRTRELRATNDSLVATNAELDTFAHSVAHDLKQPLGVVLGYASLLRNTRDEMSPEMVSELLASMQTTSERMADIIDSLLLLARVRKGQVEFSALDMDTIVRAALDQVGPLAKERNATIVVASSFPAVQGFGPWVERVWVNYLSNAIKYGGEPPRVEIGSSPTGDGKIRFWVRDNGVGLSDEARQRLFTPFTRLEPSRVAGHGLGLSIVQRIVERLGGTVSIESSPGNGSEFAFTLRT